jgi:hypothetical protein
MTIAWGRQWQPLTIPRGGTEPFNQQKLVQPPQRGHSTDDWPRNE